MEVYSTKDKQMVETDIKTETPIASAIKDTNFDENYSFDDIQHKKNNNDEYIDRANSRFYESTINRRVDSTFFSTMRVSCKLLENRSRDPLHAAIASRDEIDVQMILDELGAGASASILSRDCEGRTALHLAALSKSSRIVTALLQSYRLNEERQLSDELLKLDLEYRRTIAEIFKKSARNGVESRVTVMSQASQSSSVTDWFDKEKARRVRQLEFNIEIWWTKNLSTKDREGRTPLHYAVGCGSTARLLEAIILNGRGNFSDDKIIEVDDLSLSRDLHGSSRGAKGSGKKSRQIFRSGSLYELVSGREMAAYLKSSQHLTSAPHEPSVRADAKITKTQRLQFVLNQSLRQVSWDLVGTPVSSSEGLQQGDAFTVDYDVVVPWVLRNMLRSSAEKGPEWRSSAVERLTDMLECAEPSRLGIFVVAELGLVLGGLGIRVTTDVLREMCRRYPAAISDIREKCEWIEDKKREQHSRVSAAIADALDNFSGEKRGDKGSDEAHDIPSRADSKGTSTRTPSSSSSKHGQSDQGYDDSYEDEYESKREVSSKSSARSVPIRAVKARPNHYSSIEMQEEDENLGLDIRQMMLDISSGRGLTPIPAHTAHVQEPGDKLDKQTEDLDTRRSEARSAGSGASPTKRSVGNTNAVEGSSLVLPSCLTIGNIIQARSAVINICDSRGRSPLLIASSLGMKDLVSVLLAMGGDISMVTADGHSAFTVARNPSVRALPERMLLTWMNKREHSLGGGARFAHSALSASEPIETDEINQQLALKSRRGKELEMMLESYAMNMDERSRVVGSLLGPLESLKEAKWAYSRPPLMWAVHNGLLTAVKDLLSGSSQSPRSGTDSDPNCCDTAGRTPLHECAALVRSSRVLLMEAAVPMAEVLIAAGAGVNQASVSGRTPLHELFCANQDERVSSYRVSSEGTAAICATTAPSVDIHVAAKCRRTLVRSLLQFGADPLLMDRHGLAPLHYCAREDYADCLLEILNSGVDGAFPTRQQQSPLIIACKAGAHKTAHLLCRWDADHMSALSKRPSLTQQRNAQGKLPVQLIPRSTGSKCLDTLWSASRAGNLSSVSAIISRLKSRECRGRALWEDVDNTDSGAAPTAILEASSALNDPENAHRDLVLDSVKVRASMGGKELWLVDGIDSKSRRLRWTPLHACVIGWAEVRAAQQIAHRNTTKCHWNQGKGQGKGQGRMRSAAKGSGSGSGQDLVSDSACTALGLSPYAPPHPPSGSDSSVQTSSQLQHRNVLALLLQRHAYVDSLDVHCRTPLMLCAAFNVCEACALLLDGGAEAGATDLEGNTALHLAYAYGSWTCALYIESRCAVGGGGAGGGGGGSLSEARNNYARTPAEEAGRSAYLCPLLSVINRPVTKQEPEPEPEYSLG